VTTEPAPRTPAELGLPELPVAAGPADPAVHHVRAKLDREIRALLAYEAGTRSGADPEDLHQMRVALRRMRSVLKLSGALVGDGAEPVRAELGWLGQSLGEVRDYDVLIGHLREVIADFEVRD
jgi:CHAD domain-containing protein